MSVFRSARAATSVISNSAANNDLAPEEGRELVDREDGHLRALGARQRRDLADDRPAERLLGFELGADAGIDPVEDDVAAVRERRAPAGLDHGRRVVLADHRGDRKSVV